MTGLKKYLKPLKDNNAQLVTSCIKHLADSVNFKVIGMDINVKMLYIRFSEKFLGPADTPLKCHSVSREISRVTGCVINGIAFLVFLYPVRRQAECIQAVVDHQAD